MSEDRSLKKEGGSAIVMTEKAINGYPDAFTDRLRAPYGSSSVQVPRMVFKNKVSGNEDL